MNSDLCFHVRLLLAEANISRIALFSQYSLEAFVGDDESICCSVRCSWKTIESGR